MKLTINENNRLQLQNASHFVMKLFTSIMILVNGRKPFNKKSRNCFSLFHCVCALISFICFFAKYYFSVSFAPTVFQALHMHYATIMFGNTNGSMLCSSICSYITGHSYHGITRLLFQHDNSPAVLPTNAVFFVLDFII